MADAKRRLRHIIYGLKRKFGQPVKIRRYSALTLDRAAGTAARTDADYSIKRAIVSPASQAGDFVYDLSFIAANKNFTYGGFFDTTQRYVIFDVRDIDKASDIEFAPDRNTDRVIINSRLYEIVRVIEAEIRRIIILHVKLLESTPEIS